MLKVKTFSAVLAVVGLVTIAPISAWAATIKGQIDIAGTVSLNNSFFASGGNVDLGPNGDVIIAEGDFTGLKGLDVATLTDINFNAPGTIWKAGIFTFSATSFSDFLNGQFKGFSAKGILSAVGFDDTDSVLSFSTQTQGSKTKVSFSSTTTPVPLPAGGLLLVGALGGFVALRRRNKRAA